MRRVQIRIGLLITGLTMLSGCLVIPVAHKPQTAGPGGLIAQPPEFAFVQPGVTTRKQVQEKLGDIEVATGLTTHYWGRWTYQKWTVFAAAAAQTGAAAGSLDIKHTNNVLIDFDENGVVTQVRRVADRHMLRELRAWAEDTKERPDPSEARVLHLHDSQSQSDNAVMSLHDTTLELRCVDNQKHEAKASLVGASLHQFMRKQKGEAAAQAGQIVIMLKLADKTRMGRLVTLEMGAADLYRLVEFMQHAKHCQSGVGNKQSEAKCSPVSMPS